MPSIRIGSRPFFHQGLLRRSVALVATAALILGSCGEGSSDGEPRTEEVSLRGGIAPVPVATQVATLRATPLLLDPSTEVGTLPGFADVDSRGQASYQIPIQVAPGVGAMTPSLSLGYSSAGGNGILGVGGSLGGLSSIRRCARSVLRDGAWGPVQWDNDDALCLDGDRLVLESGTYGTAESSYRPAHDPSRRVVLRGNLDSPVPWFDVYSGDGLVTQYGTGGASLWRPDDIGEPVTYVWSIRTKRDRFDNVVEYVYSHPLVLPTGPAQLQLDEIRYAGLGPVATKRKVRLSYDDRPDHIDGWYFGAHTRMVTRLESIDVEGPSGALVRRYELEYDEGPDGRSRLNAARLCDAAGACLPDTVLEWQAPHEDAWDPFEYELDELLFGIINPGNQELLGSSRQVLLTDLDGDLSQEMIFRLGGVGFEPWTLWNPSEDAVGVTEFLTPSPPGTFDYDTVVDLPALGDDGDFFSQMVVKYQPALNVSVVAFSEDRRADLLIPRTPAYVQGDVELDDAGHAYAVGLQVVPGNDLDQVGPHVTLADGSGERIYTVVPLDHDGDRDSDVWLCRGDAHNDATWVFGLRSGPTDPGYVFTDTSIGCSVHDELSVMHAGGGQRLLVIPAYDAVSHAPIDDAAREEYGRIELDPTNSSATLVATGLPRDRYQRWHDLRCRNGLAHAYADLTVFSAGFGQDKAVDVNGDGLVDILRFELASGDGLTEQSDIEQGMPDHPADVGAAEWADPLLCTAEAEEHQDAGIRLYTNTGEGFARGPFIHEFEGIAHANYWLNFVGAQLLDADDDGLADLAMPSTGPDGSWTLLRSRGDGTFAASPTALPEGWPAYSDDEEWREALDDARRSRVFNLQTDRRGTGELIFVGQVGDEPTALWPTAVNRWERRNHHISTGRVAAVTDGLGAVTSFEYEGLDVSDMVAPNPQSAPVPGAMFVVSRMYGSYRPTIHYEYVGAVLDRLGGGLLGFAERRERNQGDGQHKSYTTTRYSQTFDEDLGDWSSAGRPLERVVGREVDGHEGMPGDSSDDHMEVERTTWLWTTAPTTLAGGVISTTYASTQQVRGYNLDCAKQGWCELIWLDPDLDAYTPYRDRTRSEVRDSFGTLTHAETYTVLGEEVTVDYLDIDHDTDQWLLGRVGTVETTSCSYFGTCATQTTSSTYDAATGALDSTTIEPGDPVLELRSDMMRDPFGNVRLTTNTAPAGLRWSSTSFDDEGVFPVSFTNQLGQTAHVIHDAASGAVVAEVDVAGTTWLRRFDGFYRPTQESLYDQPLGASDNAANVYEYLEPDPLEEGTAMRVRILDRTGQRTTTHLRSTGEPVMRVWWGMTPLQAGLPQQIGAGLEVFERYIYDVHGHRIGTSVPDWVGSGDPLLWNTTEVDPAGNPLYSTAPDGTVIASFAYSNLTSVTGSSSVTISDADGHTTTKTFDGDGALYRSTDANGVVTCFDTGAFGHLAKVRRNCGAGPGPRPVTTIERDAFGRVTSESDPAFGTRTSEWNAFGELVLATDAAGDETEYDYDLLGRVEDVTDADGVTWFGWDDARPGALAWTSTPGGVDTSYEYDGWGRLRFEHTTVPSASGVDDYVFENVWGAGPRLSEIRYPAVDGEPGFAVGLRWDQPGYLRGVFQPLGLSTWWMGRTANPRGQFLGEWSGNGVSTKREWNRERGWPDSIVTTSGGTALQSLVYVHRPDGELSMRIDELNPKKQQDEFTYDPAHRLTATLLTQNDLDVALQTVSYDAIGNIKEKKGVPGYSYDADGVLTEVDGESVFHDANGNIFAHGERTLTYTPFGKVASITDDDATQTFAYAAAGTRVRRSDTATGTDTVTIGDTYERVVGADGVTRSVTYRVAAAGRIVAEFVRKPNVPPAAPGWGTTARYMHDDALGSTNVVSDSVGARFASNSHDAWGSARKDDDWSVGKTDDEASKVGPGYTGHRGQIDAGLIDMRGRMYDPKLGRFMSPDPLVADPTDGAWWNRYSYVGNRPLAFTDPTGFSPDPIGDMQMESCEANGRQCSQNDDGSVVRYITVTGAETAPDGGGGSIGWRGGGRYNPWGFGEATSSGATVPMTRKQLEYMRKNVPNVEFIVVRSKLEAEALRSVRGPGVSRPPWKNPFGNLLKFADALDTGAQLGLFVASFHPLGNVVATAVDVADGLAAASGGDYTSLALTVGLALLPGPSAANAADGVKLAKGLASEQQVAELLAGKFTVIAGKGTTKPIKDVERVVAEWGGQTGDWQKIGSSNYKASDGASFETHAYRNARSGEIVEMKTKFQ